MWENFIFTYFPRKLFWRVPCRRKRTSGLSILRQSWLCFWPLISNSNCLQAELQSKICEESVVDFFYEIRLGHQHNSVSAFWSRSPSRISGHTIKSLTTVICWADWDRNFFFFFSAPLPFLKMFQVLARQSPFLLCGEDVAPSFSQTQTHPGSAGHCQRRVSRLKFLLPQAHSRLKICCVCPCFWLGVQYSLEEKHLSQ